MHNSQSLGALGEHGRPRECGRGTRSSRACFGALFAPQCCSSAPRRRPYTSNVLLNDERRTINRGARSRAQDASSTDGGCVRGAWGQVRASVRWGWTALRALLSRHIHTHAHAHDTVAQRPEPGTRARVDSAAWCVMRDAWCSMCAVRGAEQRTRSPWPCFGALCASALLIRATVLFVYVECG